MDIGDLCDLCEEYGDHDCKRCNLGNPCIDCADVRERKSAGMKNNHVNGGTKVQGVLLERRCDGREVYNP